MGAISDDIIAGRACSLCGCYFKDPDKEDQTYKHGVPTLCWYCYDDYVIDGGLPTEQKSKVDTF